MEPHRQFAEFSENTATPKAKVSGTASRSRRTFWSRMGFVLLILVLVGTIGRALLPWGLRGYVNRTLDRTELYKGKIGALHVHLWRGAYSIDDVRIDKTTGNLPVPFFAAKRVDFAMEWRA